MNKKPLVFSALAFCALIVHSCTLPSAVEIKAHPKMSLTAKMNISDLFSMNELMDGFSSQSDISIYDCTKVNSPQTFLVLTEESKIQFGTIGTFSSAFGSASVNDTIAKFEVFNDAAPSIDFGDLSSYLDDYFDDFEFPLDSIKGEIVISGNGDPAKDIIECLSITLKDGSNNPISSSPVSPSGKIVPKNSSPAEGPPERYGLTDNPNITSLSKLPGVGIGFDATSFFNNRSTDLEINYTVEFEGTVTQNIKDGIDNNDDFEIVFDILIWLPLEFKAKTIATGNLLKPYAPRAALGFPDLLDETADILGREPGKKNDMGDMIEKLLNASFSMKLNKPLFKANTARMSISPFLSLSPPSSGTELKVKLTEKDMAVFNNQIPFAPQPRILFEPGSILTIPRDLKMNLVSFDAEVMYRIDL